MEALDQAVQGTQILNHTSAKKEEQKRRDSLNDKQAPDDEHKNDMIEHLSTQVRDQKQSSQNDRIKV